MSRIHSEHPAHFWKPGHTLLLRLLPVPQCIWFFCFSSVRALADHQQALAVPYVPVLFATPNADPIFIEMLVALCP